jgi:hypothetical protein
MLPVKNILKEYLKDDEDDEEKEEEKEVEKEEEKQEEKKEEKEVEKQEEKGKEVEKEVEKQEEKGKGKENDLPVIETIEEPPIINVETEPSVKFAEVDTIIDIEPRMRDGLDEDDELFHVLDEEGTSLEDYEELDKKQESTSIDFELLD